MAPAEVADGLEHTRLGRHVQPGRGLVADDDLRTVGEGHRDRHALLLAARELVCIAPQEEFVRGQRHLGERLGDALPTLVLAPSRCVGVEHLGQLGADAQRGIERRAGILRDVGHDAAAQMAQLVIAKSADVSTVDRDSAAADPSPAANVAQKCHANGRLPRARLAHEAEHLARMNLQGDLVDDVDTRAQQLDAQVRNVDDRRAHESARRSIPASARDKPSVIRFVPIVRSPIAITGSSTAHGCTVIDSRFSLIMRPQSASGGWSPKPRKLMPATRPIEYVIRSPASTSRGLVTFGSTSPNTIRQRFSPTTSALLTKSRSTISSAAPRMTRATRGAWVSPTVRTISHSFGPSADTARSTKMICGNASSTSLARISTSSSQLRAYAAIRPTTT